MHKKISWCGFDVDGTLRDTNNEIPESLIELLSSINRSKANTVKFFLSSGRSLQELIELNRKFNGIFSIISAENGGLIYNIQENRTHSYLSEKGIKNVQSCVYVIKLTFPHVNITILHKETVWSGAFGENLSEVYAFCRDYIKNNKLGLNVYAHHGDPRKVLDLVTTEIDKINIFSHLKLGSEKETVIYFGDAANDFKMLNDSRVTPCTVSNAETSIQKLIRERNGFSSERQCGYGVLDILEKYFF